MNKKISVIVPIYNVEKYLHRCVDSIVNQTYKNLEIILVDDGSPDKCPEMCDEWAAKDSRIKVIHKENGGLSDARNAALDVMKGDYVTFIDSDDWVSEYYCEVLMNGVLADGADISVVDYKRVDDNGVIDTAPSFQTELINSDKAIDKLFGGEQIRYVTAWGKLFRSDLFSDIRFPFGKLHEDVFTTYKLYHKANGISVCQGKLYAYYINENGIIGTFSLKRLDSLDAQVEKLSFIKEHYPAKADIAERSYFASCRYHFQMLCYNKTLDPEKVYRKQILKRIETVDLNSVKHYYKGKQRVWFDLFRVAPYTTSNIRNRFKIGW